MGNWSFPTPDLAGAVANDTSHLKWGGGTLQWEWCHWQSSSKNQNEPETQHREQKTEGVTCQHQSIMCDISVTQADKLQITISHYPDRPLFHWQYGWAVARASVYSLAASVPFKLTRTTRCPTRVRRSDPSCLLLLPCWHQLLVLSTFKCWVWAVAQITELMPLFLPSFLFGSAFKPQT